MVLHLMLFMMNPVFFPSALFLLAYSIICLFLVIMDTAPCVSSELSLLLECLLTCGLLFWLVPDSHL